MKRTQRTSSMNIFTYGSLMYPAVINALTDCNFSYEDVTIQDFERRAIQGKKYPGLRRHIGSMAQGRLWFDIDESSMRMLDSFEDSLYERQTVEITSKSRGVINAFAYVVPKHLEHTLEDIPWDPNVFENMHLAQYVKMCERFRLDNI
jgi:gamma-glutamylcyclotransferase (GGCT)/AIG2-like uncharacterized protein YtfP